MLSTQSIDTEILERALCEIVERRAGNTILHTPQWFQVLTPGEPGIFRNGVYRSVLGESEADAKIEQVVKLYERANLKFRWVVGPSARPLDLGERLLKQGFLLHDEMTGMAIPTSFTLLASPEIEVHPISEGPRLRDWLSIVEEHGWQIQGPAGSGADFVAYRGGRAVGVGSVRLLTAFGLLTHAFVLPEHRGKSVYRALLAARLNWLRERDYARAGAHCAVETSAPLCARLGFVPVCDFKAYTFGA